MLICMIHQSIYVNADVCACRAEEWASTRKTRPENNRSVHLTIAMNANIFIFIMCF